MSDWTWEHCSSGLYCATGGGYRPDPETAVHIFCHAVPVTWYQMGVILVALWGQRGLDLTSSRKHLW
ncbi:MAG TPA: hypothetical protein DIT67_13530 [Octadecabacter sp.]|nr:hypothetical protein [Octadecabacter sp.]